MAGDGPERLPEALAKRVLERAAQLDESERMTVSIPDLRTAAVEAGISSSAVDQALSEMAANQATLGDRATLQPVRNRSGSRRRTLIVVAIVIVLGAIYLRGRLVPENLPTAPGPQPTQSPPPR